MHFRSASPKVCCNGSFYDLSDGPVPHGTAQSWTSRNISSAFLCFLLLLPTCHGYRGLYNFSRTYFQTFNIVCCIRYKLLFLKIVGNWVVILWPTGGDVCIPAVRLLCLQWSLSSFPLCFWIFGHGLGFWWVEQKLFFCSCSTVLAQSWNSKLCKLIVLYMQSASCLTITRGYKLIGLCWFCSQSNCLLNI